MSSPASGPGSSSIAIGEERVALAEAARRFVVEQCPSSVVRHAVETGERGFPPFAKSMGDLGWFGLHLPESCGGQGYGCAEAVIVAEEFARAPAPGPMLSTLAAGFLLRITAATATEAPTSGSPASGSVGSEVAARDVALSEVAVRGSVVPRATTTGSSSVTSRPGSGLDDRLGRIARGEASVAIALDPMRVVHNVDGNTRAVTATADPDDGQGAGADSALDELVRAADASDPADQRVDEPTRMASRVTWGAVAGAGGVDAVIVPIPGDGDDGDRGGIGPGVEHWYLFDANMLTTRTIDPLDLTRSIAEVTSETETLALGRHLAGIDRAIVEAAMATFAAAECAGIASWCVETAAAYAAERHQFGRPIGQFQAVKHRCADMLVAAEATRAVAWDAAAAADAYVALLDRRDSADGELRHGLEAPRDDAGLSGDTRFPDGVEMRGDGERRGDVPSRGDIDPDHDGGPDHDAELRGEGGPDHEAGLSGDAESRGHAGLDREAGLRGGVGSDHDNGSRGDAESRGGGPDHDSESRDCVGSDHDDELRGDEGPDRDAGPGRGYGPDLDARTGTDPDPEEIAAADRLAAIETARVEWILAAASAAVVALDSAVRVAEDCIQVLGGIGFTWEHDAHLHLRRAVALRQQLGGTARWRRQLASTALAGARRRLRVEVPVGAEDRRAAIGAEADELAGLHGPERRARLVESGWLVPHWPEPWGIDADAITQLLIDEELRRVKVRRPHLQVGAWAAPTIAAHGTPEQQQRWVRPTLLGEISWCQLFSEPEAGSDLAGLRTRATKVDGGWSVTGQKVWTTMAAQADWGICLVRTNPRAPKHAGITYLIVDMKSPGIDVRPLREMTGLEMFNEVFFDDVFVPDDCVIGEVDGGWALARTTLGNERVAMGSGSSFGGGVENLLDLVRRHVAEPPTSPELRPNRVVGRASLAEVRLEWVDSTAGVDPVVLDRVGALVAEAHAVATLGARSTLRSVSGARPGPEASVRKLLGVEHDQRVQEFGLDLLGPAGAAIEGDAPTWTFGFLANRCLTIAGGTSEIQRNVIGERLLGLPRDVEPATESEPRSLR